MSRTHSILVASITVKGRALYSKNRSRPLFRAGLLVGEAAVVAIYARDETLTGGEAEKEHGDGEDHGNDSGPAGSEGVAHDAEHGADGPGRHVRGGCGPSYKHLEKLAQRQDQARTHITETRKVI